MRVPKTDFNDITPFLYYIRVPADSRDGLRAALSEKGIDTGIHWQPGHWFSLFKDCRRGDLSVTDQVGKEILSLEQLQAEERYHVGPVADERPDKAFDQRWTIVLLEKAAERLREEFHEAGKGPQFEVLKAFLCSEGSEEAYAEAGARLGRSPKTVSVAVHRLRRRFRYLVRSTIADTVTTPEEVEEEYRSLFG